MAPDPNVIELAALADTPVAPETTLFCEMVLAAFSATEPPLEVTLPLSVMLPALVRLVATRVTLPVASMPSGPISRGLLAVSDALPLVALIRPVVLMPPVSTILMSPLAVVTP